VWNSPRTFDSKNNQDSNVHNELYKISEKIKFSGHILKSDVENIINTVIKAGMAQLLSSLNITAYFFISALV
jgi:hypothetical protein